MPAVAWRLARLGSLLVSITAVASAAEDLLITLDGESLHGRILQQDATCVVVAIDGRPCTLYRSRLAEIRPGGAPPPGPSSADPMAPPPAHTPAWTWEVLAATGIGLHHGQLEGSGSITDGGGRRPLRLDFDIRGLDALPPAQLRLVAAAAGPVLALQAASCHPAGDGVRLDVLGAEALAGWRWQLDASASAELLLGAGWQQAVCRRQLDIRDAGGGALGSLEDTTDLTGWCLRGEGALRWQAGRWRLGGAAGVTSSHLAGETAWATDQGVRGREDLSATLLGGYAVAQAAIAW